MSSRSETMDMPIDAASPAPARREGLLVLNIQALRAVAALFVVLAHAKNVLPENIAGRLGFGVGGVDLFFVISGFIMVLVTTGRETSPGKFALNRILRIVPLYWAITLTLFGIALFLPGLFQSTRIGTDVVELLKSLFFIPYMKNGSMTPVVFVGWTLNYEMFFYSLFTCGLFLGRKGIPVVIGTILLLTALHPLAETPVFGFYTDPILLEFAAGMVIGWSYPRLRGSIGLPLVIVGLALFISSPGFWPDAHRALIYGIPSIMIVIGALMLEKQGKTLGAMKMLGDASYSIYLTHFLVASVIKKAYEMMDPSMPLAIASIAAALIAASIVGVIVHYRVEKPLIEAARRLTRRRSTRLAPAAW